MTQMKSLYQTENQCRRPSRAVASGVGSPKGLGRARHKPLMQNAEDHKSPAPTVILPGTISMEAPPAKSAVGGSVTLSEIEIAIQRKLAMAGLDAYLSMEEMAMYLGMPAASLRRKAARLPGYRRDSERCAWFHLRSFDAGMARRTI